MCHVQSLEKDFYLGALGSFDRVFTLNENKTLKIFLLRFIEIKKMFTILIELSSGLAKYD
jgi:hypothetical protein